MRRTIDPNLFIFVTPGWDTLVATVASRGENASSRIVQRYILMQFEMWYTHIFNIYPVLVLMYNISHMHAKRTAVQE